MAMGQSAASPLVEAALADAPVPRRLVAIVVVRATIVVLATLLVYGLVPVREETSTAVAVMAILGLLAVAFVFARQLTRIKRSRRPVLAAIEALALVVTLFVVLFAFLYVSLSAADEGAFTQPVTKVSGVYFTVTVLATVGFGDISAVTDMARLVVTVQMVLDLILIGVAVKVLGTSARRAVEAKVAAREGAGGESGTSQQVVADVITDAAGSPGGAGSRGQSMPADEEG